MVHNFVVNLTKIVGGWLACVATQRRLRRAILDAFRIPHA
jgi:hypothetical protein